MNPRYQIYIPTKGRFESCLTMRAFDKIGVSYKAVIEPQEVESYIAHGIKKESILTLPHSDKGLVVTRNWIWDHAQAAGYKRFWTFDDNIEGFLRLNQNAKIGVTSGTFLPVLEDFVERYQNIAIAGYHYDFFAKCKDKLPPFYRNRRVYSNMLILTDIPYRNEGFYNDDTDLCLRVLKDGWCTVLFLAFLALKSTTMTVKGGMTPHYQKEGSDIEADGRYRMAKELSLKHPDLSRITWKFNRWQHHVDYSRFKQNQLKLRTDIVIPEGINEYGMELIGVRVIQKVKKESLVTPQARAEARDSFVRSFDKQFSDWVEIAKCCVEVEKDRDWEILGFQSYGAWMVDAAPRSRSYLYLVIGRYKELVPDIAESELREIPLGSAGILKQLSSAVRKQSKIRQAAKKKPSELRQVLRDSQPEQHIEVLEVRTLRFTESQAGVFDEMLECYAALNASEIHSEEAVEWLASQWLDSKWEDSPYSNREKARQVSA